MKNLVPISMLCAIALGISAGACTAGQLSKVQDATNAGRQLCDWALNHAALFGATPELERVLLVCEGEATVRDIARAYTGDVCVEPVPE